MVPVHVLAVVRAQSSASVADSSALLFDAGVSLVAHATKRLLDADLVDQVVVVADETVSGVDDGPRVRLVVGPHSWPAVVNSLVSVEYPDTEVLLAHDVLHGFAGVDLVRRVVAEVWATGEVVVPVLPCTDTVKQLDPDGVVIGTPDRALLRVAQTPEGYPAALVRRAGGELSGLRARARTIPGDPHAPRLVSPFEVAMAVGAASGGTGSEGGP